MELPNVGLGNVDLSGGLGEVFATRQQMDAEKMRQAQMEKEGLMNTYQQLQNERYGSATPLELQKLGGEATSAEVKGNIDKSTQKYTIDQKISEALRGKSEAELAKYQADSESMVAQLTSAKALAANAEKNGQLGNVLPQLAEKFGLDMNDPQVQQRFSHILQDPSKLNGELDRMIKMYQQVGLNSTKHLQEMTKQASINESHEAVGKGHDAASRYAADQSLAAAKYRADQVAAKGTGKPLSMDQQFAQANATLASPTATESEKQMAEALIQNIQQLKVLQNSGAFNPQVDLGGKVPMNPSPAVQVQSVKPARVPSQASPAAQAVGMGGGNDETAQAIAWLKANPNDPRAAAVKKKLGL